MYTLNQLEIYECATVTKVLAKGKLRRRFLDIGIIEGTKIKCVAISPQGDPKAYFIRGAVIALRNSDSALIEVGDRYE